jgi:hypothetical protein
MVVDQFKELPNLFGTNGLLSRSQGPVAGLFPEPGKSNPLYHILGGNLSLKVISSSSPTSKV